MALVHHCGFCGWRREASSSTVLAPSCQRCGCTLRAATETEAARGAGVAPDWVPPSRNPDISTMFALLAAGPVLLPVVGVDLGDFAFAVPLVLLAFAMVRAWAASERGGPLRLVWRLLAGAAGLGALSSAIAMAAAVANVSPVGAFDLGLAASLALAIGVVCFLRRSAMGVPAQRLFDGALVALPTSAVGTYFVAVPGFASGDPVLTAVFLIDLLALLAASIALVVQPSPAARRIAAWLTVACAGSALGDAWVALARAGRVGPGTVVTAICWGLAGYALAAGSDEGMVAAPALEQPASHEPVGDRRWVLGQVALPLVAVLSLPALGLGLWLADGSALAVDFFGSCFALMLVLVFGRQAYLLVDNRRVVRRERELLGEMQRRNEELEALTGLATTMTQTLEEAPIIEQSLGVLHLAGGASSSALHTHVGDRLELQAVAGDWEAEHVWAVRSLGDAFPAGPVTRGRRQIVRLPLSARGSEVGVVTLIRAAERPFTDDELALLRLLVDELAVAVQNARDYREKLEQAIRDPLTGLYNRRFLFEALEKDVRRHQRYGSSFSLVLLDVDNFKHINDCHGHATGDDVLREIAARATSVVRPADSLARIGGEEFALLLPETDQLEALLVADRVRAAVARDGLVDHLRVTLSGGVASCPLDATSLDDLHRKADGALYWAKHNGKDICALAGEAVPIEQAGGPAGMISHLYGLSAAIDAEYLMDRDHCERVAAYAVMLGQSLGMSADRLVCLRRAALLHDIGKVAVDGAILSKPARLTAREFAQIKRHPEIGAQILAKAGLDEEAGWVRHHHERIDGRGYPDGLSGSQIPLESRILFVADAFEAMTSDRAYTKRMSTGGAIAELRRHAGTHFDAEIVERIAALVSDPGSDANTARVHERAASG